MIVSIGVTVFMFAGRFRSARFKLGPGEIEVLGEVAAKMEAVEIKVDAVQTKVVEVAATSSKVEEAINGVPDGEPKLIDRVERIDQRLYRLEAAQDDYWSWAVAALGVLAQDRALPPYPRAIDDLEG